MLPYIGEFIGTMIMMIFINGVVAGCVLNKTGLQGGPVMICIGAAFGVMVPVWIFGQASGAHFNPAITIALEAGSMFNWSLVPGYIVCQVGGAFTGAVIAYLLYADHFDATDNPDLIRAVFCTSPTIPNFFRNLLSEIVGTFLLVFPILGMSQVPGLSAGTGKIYIWALVVAIGMCLGGLTGFAINPARDLGPRIAHAILPIRAKGPSHWGDYAIVPILGPIIGGLLAVGLFKIIPWA